ncbi:hypothetical protein ACIBKX_37975 [Streptomyces sp. NPDC050658]|uniref:nSTAND1 domain-containing NTPase n=1 Tax=unclassified Streptomyces TaxID=2593676 RepID=UPI0034265BAD
MGRREKPIDPVAGPVQQLAFELRKLRREAGSPTYQVMAKEAEYSIAALARAAAGETLPSLPLTLAYVKACGGGPAEWERRWHAARDEESAQPRDVDEESADPPYQGLARFEAGHRARFFGRTRLTDDLAGLAEARRCVIVIGPSGSGKSSLLRAGFIPRLQNPEDPVPRPAAIRILTPGPSPAHAHRRLFTPAGGEGDTWLVVDQFEEIFTLCQDPAERSEFIGLLLSARNPDSRLRVVIGVRADFYARCLEHEGLAALLGEASLPVGPMTADELREVIVKPAAAEGLIVERTLTARLIDEISGEPGGLPLLSHTLLETWRRRRGRTLTLEGYESTGGIHGAIAQSAEDLYTQLTPRQGETARRILLRLITPGQGTADTRRPVERAELATADCDPDTVLQRLARARLVTLDDDTVDLAHESLITAWPRLHGWIEDNRERLRRHRRLTDAAHNWQARDRDSGALLRGTELTEAQDAFRTPEQQDELTEMEGDFLHQSVRAEQRRSHRARSFTAALATLLVLALIAAGVAYQQRNAAEQQRGQAVTAGQQALSRQLAAQSGTLMETNPDLGSLLAVQAYRTSPTTEARISLYKAADEPLRHRLAAAKADAVAVAFSPDGRTLATGSRGGTVRLWDAGTGRLRHTVTGHRGAVSSLAVGPDGHTLLIGGAQGTVWRGDTRTGRVSKAFTQDAELEKGAPTVLSPDGKTVARGDRRGLMRLWDIRTGRERATLAGHKVAVAGFSPDGRTLATSDFDDRVRLWDAATGKVRTTLPDRQEEVTALAFSRDGETLATGSGAGTARLWDAGTGRARSTLEDRYDGEVLTLAFSPDGRTLAAGGWAPLRLWDTGTGRSRTDLAGHDGSVNSLVFGPDSRTLATSGSDGTVRLWDVGTGRTLTGHKGPVHSVVFGPDSRTLATSSYDGSIRLWDIRTGRARTTFTGYKGIAAPSVAFTADGRSLVVADSDDGRVRVHDLRTGRSRTTLTDPERNFSEPTALGPDGTTLVTGGDSAGSVRLRDVRTGRTRTTLTGRHTLANTAVFTPDGHTLAVGYDAGRTMRLWDIRTGRGRDFSGRGGWLPLAFSRDGRTLATRGSNGTVRLRDATTGRVRAVMTGSEDVTAGSAAFSPDGRTLAMEQGDGTMRLWDTVTGRTRATLTGRTTAAPVFSPDGHVLAGTAGKTVRLWDVRLPGPSAAQHKICRAVARNLTAEERTAYLPDSPPGPVCPSG